MNPATMTLRKKLVWISILYFAEGLPYGLVYDVLSVYFRQSGVSLKEIGFLFFLTLPWAIKFLWSPLVDRLWQRRVWVMLSCVTMAAVMFSVPLFDPAHPSTGLWALLLLFTVASATQDIAIDAYTIGLLSKGEEGVANGVRVALYRAAILLGGGGTMFLVRPLGWTWVFLILSIAFVVLALAAWVMPPVEVVHQPPREFARHFWAFLSRPGSIAVFTFVLAFRIPELLLGPMIKPFWVDRGMTTEEIGAISTSVGVFVTVFGALVGGLFTTRFGLFTGLWSLGLTQALPNLAYAAVAHYDLGRPWLYSASIFESFASGLGTAAFISFLMRICDKDQAATQFALLSALFGLTRFLGGFSGKGVELFGYGGFFALTFVLSLPAYLLLPWVRRWIGPDGGRAGGVGDNAKASPTRSDHASGRQPSATDRHAAPASAAAR